MSTRSEMTKLELTPSCCNASTHSKIGTAMQTLVPKVPLEVQKNRHFFINHVYYHVVTLGHRSHHRSAVTW